MVKLTRQQVLLIAAEALADPRTVERVYAGKKTLTLVRERVAAAAGRLQLPSPPVQK